MCKAIYSGSFDPFTNGHLNVLDHSAKIFEEVYLCVSQNPKKKRFTSLEKTEEILFQIIKQRYNNVKVISDVNGLVYKKAKLLGCEYLIRGIRNNGLDYSYEENLADFNKEVGGINTIFIRADLYKSVSSTMIKVLLSNNEDISQYVPKEIYEYLKECKN